MHLGTEEYDYKKLFNISFIIGHNLDARELEKFISPASGILLSDSWYFGLHALGFYYIVACGIFYSIFQVHVTNQYLKHKIWQNDNDYEGGKSARNGRLKDRFFWVGT